MVKEAHAAVLFHHQWDSHGESWWPFRFAEHHRPTAEAAAQDELLSWTRPSQEEYWQRRRRHWGKLRLAQLQTAAEERGLWAAGGVDMLRDRLLRFDYDPACLLPPETTAAIRTPTAEQAPEADDLDVLRKKGGAGEDWRASPSATAAADAALSVGLLEATELLWRLSEFLGLEPMTATNLRSIVGWSDAPPDAEAVNCVLAALASALPEEAGPERGGSDAESEHEVNDASDPDSPGPNAANEWWARTVVEHTAGWCPDLPVLEPIHRIVAKLKTEGYRGLVTTERVELILHLCCEVLGGDQCREHMALEAAAHEKLTKVRDRRVRADARRQRQRKAENVLDAEAMFFDGAADVLTKRLEPLGSDRWHRRYWWLHSEPGKIYVQHPVCTRPFAGVDRRAAATCAPAEESDEEAAEQSAKESHDEIAVEEAVESTAELSPGSARRRSSQRTSRAPAVYDPHLEAARAQLATRAVGAAITDDDRSDSGSEGDSEDSFEWSCRWSVLDQKDQLEALLQWLDADGAREWALAQRIDAKHRRICCAMGGQQQLDTRVRPSSEQLLAKFSDGGIEELIPAPAPLLSTGDGTAASEAGKSPRSTKIPFVVAAAVERLVKSVERDAKRRADQVERDAKRQVDRAKRELKRQEDDVKRECAVVCNRLVMAVCDVARAEEASLKAAAKVAARVEEASLKAAAKVAARAEKARLLAESAAARAKAQKDQQSKRELQALIARRCADEALAHEKLRVATMPDASLPDGWAVDWCGRHLRWYFIDTHSNASQWDKPSVPAEVAMDRQPGVPADEDKVTDEDFSTAVQQCADGVGDPEAAANFTQLHTLWRTSCDDDDIGDVELRQMAASRLIAYRNTWCGPGSAAKDQSPPPGPPAGLPPPPSPGPLAKAPRGFTNWGHADSCAGCRGGGKKHTCSKQRAAGAVSPAATIEAGADGGRTNDDEAASEKPSSREDRAAQSAKLAAEKKVKQELRKQEIAAKKAERELKKQDIAAKRAEREQKKADQQAKKEQLAAQRALKDKGQDKTTADQPEPLTSAANGSKAVSSASPEAEEAATVMKRRRSEKMAKKAKKTKKAKEKKEKKEKKKAASSTPAPESDSDDDIPLFKVREHIKAAAPSSTADPTVVPALPTAGQNEGKSARENKYPPERLAQPSARLPNPSVSTPTYRVHSCFETAANEPLASTGDDELLSDRNFAEQHSPFEQMERSGESCVHAAHVAEAAQLFASGGSHVPKRPAADLRKRGFDVGSVGPPDFSEPKKKKTKKTKKKRKEKEEDGKETAARSKRKPAADGCKDQMPPEKKKISKNAVATDFSHGARPVPAPASPKPVTITTAAAGQVRHVD